MFDIKVFPVWLNSKLLTCPLFQYFLKDLQNDWEIGKILKGNAQDIIVVDMWHVLQRWFEYWWATLSIPHVQESIHTSTATHAILDKQNLYMTFKNCSQHPRWKKKTQNISTYLYMFKIQKMLLASQDPHNRDIWICLAGNEFYPGTKEICYEICDVVIPGCGIDRFHNFVPLRSLQIGISIIKRNDQSSKRVSTWNKQEVFQNFVPSYLLCLHHTHITWCL